MEARRGTRPTVFLLCGLPGSGKTTLAHQIERDRPALRFSEDEWIARLFDARYIHDDAKRVTVKEVQWETAARVLRLGVDVVLDWGFWGRSERDDFRARAAALDVSAVLLYLAVPRDELVRRLLARNAALPPATFHVEAADLDSWLPLFQPPDDDEDAVIVASSLLASP